MADDKKTEEKKEAKKEADGKKKVSPAGKAESHTSLVFIKSLALDNWKLI